MSKSWSAPTSWEEVCRRNAGRAHYHSVRRVQRKLRRIQVLRLLEVYGHYHGVQVRIARELGVSQASVSRDINYLLQTHGPCPMCESILPRDELDLNQDLYLEHLALDSGLD